MSFFAQDAVYHNIPVPPREGCWGDSRGVSRLRRMDDERKTVTALFADIKGSTELMRDLDPEAKA